MFKSRYDPFFEMKLESGLFRTAYDLAARRYVQIKRVDKDPETGKIVITARRESDGRVHKYSPCELTNFCL